MQNKLKLLDEHLVGQCDHKADLAELIGGALSLLKNATCHLLFVFSGVLTVKLGRPCLIVVLLLGGRAR